MSRIGAPRPGAANRAANEIQMILGEAMTQDDDIGGGETAGM